jgi:hypothetical protein
LFITFSHPELIVWRQVPPQEADLLHLVCESKCYWERRVSGNDYSHCDIRSYAEKQDREYYGETELLCGDSSCIDFFRNELQKKYVTTTHTTYSNPVHTVHYQRFVSTIPTRNDAKNILTHNYTDHLIDRIYGSARNDTKNILTYNSTDHLVDRGVPIQYDTSPYLDATPLYVTAKKLARSTHTFTFTFPNQSNAFI